MISMIQSVLYTHGVGIFLHVLTEKGQYLIRVFFSRVDLTDGKLRFFNSFVSNSVLRGVIGKHEVGAQGR